MAFLSTGYQNHFSPFSSAINYLLPTKKEKLVAGGIVGGSAAVFAGRAIQEIPAKAFQDKMRMHSLPFTLFVDSVANLTSIDRTIVKSVATSASLFTAYQLGYSETSLTIESSTQRIEQVRCIARGMHELLIKVNEVCIKGSEYETKCYVLNRDNVEDINSLDESRKEFEKSISDLQRVKLPKALKDYQKDINPGVLGRERPELIVEALESPEDRTLGVSICQTSYQTAQNLADRSLRSLRRFELLLHNESNNSKITSICKSFRTFQSEVNSGSRKINFAVKRYEEMYPLNRAERIKAFIRFNARNFAIYSTVGFLLS